MRPIRTSEISLGVASCIYHHPRGSLSFLAFGNVIYKRHGPRFLVDPRSIPKSQFNTIIMKPITSTSLLFLSGLVSSLAQDTTQPSPDGASLTSASGAAATSSISPEIEKNRVECFQDCYRKYGSFPNCPLGKDKFFECWCGENDWVEREEDCVWDVCGVDAYNSM